MDAIGVHTGWGYDWGYKTEDTPVQHPLLILADSQRLSDTLQRSLNPAKVSAAKAKDGPKLADGGGLFLLVLPSPSGKPRKHWRYKYRINGREGLFAIGSFPEIGLADARRIHLAARWLVERGIHPAHYAREQRDQLDAEEHRRKAGTFAAVCEKWLERDAGKISPGSMAQRRRELDNDVLPVLRSRLIGQIRKDELTDLLHKIEKRAPEVARNVRTYLAGIFDYAIEAGLVTGSPVPGRRVLRPRNQTPHPAMPLKKVGGFLRAIDGRCNRQTSIAMRLLVLTAVRKSELLNARWSELDLDKAEWNLPATRMKMRKPHWVPLSRQAVELLRELRRLSHGSLLFPNQRDPHKPMAGVSLNAVLRRLKFLEEAKPHGFRSTFSTYLNEVGENPDVIEACLAHKPKDIIRAKYNRADYRNDQRKLLQSWADTVDALAAGVDVVPFNKRGAA
jgi:integrase